MAFYLRDISGILIDILNEMGKFKAIVILKTNSIIKQFVAADFIYKLYSYELELNILKPIFAKNSIREIHGLDGFSGHLVKYKNGEYIKYLQNSPSVTGSIGTPGEPGLKGIEK
ncbi:Collagen alpha-1(XXIV) chain [Dirofilaria immitis]